MSTSIEESLRLSRDATRPPPLSSMLQSLSDICTRASLLHNIPQALIISDSIRRHIINPLRAFVYTNYTHSFVSLDSPTEALRTATLAHLLIEKCFTCKGGFLPICKTWDILHNTLLSLPKHSQPYRMLRHVWNDMITILRGQLFLLLIHARISDPHNEFFISPTSVVAENLPSFISVEVAQHIYSAYKATKCALSLSHQEISFSLYPTDEFKHILADPISAELQIESAAIQWRRRASLNISQVFPFLKVRDRIRNLRTYLLHGECSFWRFFFDLLRSTALPPLTSVESRAKSEKILNRILQTTITEYGVVDALFELEVREKGDIIPTFTLSFVESQILASRAYVYCDLFSVTFSIRRAACELQACYMELQAHRKSFPGVGQFQTAKWYVQLFELRRRMACFIDGYEWYIQAHVLQPSIDSLLTCLGGEGLKGTRSDRMALFDTVVRHHEEVMDSLLAKCFVGERMIMARLQAIVSACLNVGDLVRGLARTASWNESRCSETLEVVERIKKDFDRNHQLLVRMLNGVEKRARGSKVTDLLQQIDLGR